MSNYQQMQALRLKAKRAEELHNKIEEIKKLPINPPELKLFNSMGAVIKLNDDSFRDIFSRGRVVVLEEYTKEFNALVCTTGIDESVAPVDPTATPESIPSVQ